jgi:hypothetical protein
MVDDLLADHRDPLPIQIDPIVISEVSVVISQPYGLDRRRVFRHTTS